MATLPPFANVFSPQEAAAKVTASVTFKKLRLKKPERSLRFVVMLLLPPVMHRLALLPSGILIDLP